MAYHTSQKQPMKKKKEVKAEKKVTKRVEVHDPEFNTSVGDLGVMRNNTLPIPRQTKAPTMTGNGASNHVDVKNAMSRLMKRQGMMV